MNRDIYFQDLSDFLNASEMQYVQTAYWLCKDAHRTQVRRLTGERYFEHVRRVSYNLVIKYGYRDQYHAALGLLHDVIEDTFVPTNVIVNLFGGEMYNDLLKLSKEVPSFNVVTGELIGRAKKQNHEYYPDLLEANDRVRRTKGVDREDNLTDLGSWESQRKEKYIKETNLYVLPIVEKTDLRIAAAIQNKLALAT